MADTPPSIKDLRDPFADSFRLPDRAPPGDHPKPSGMGLSDLARGLQYVVNEAAMAAHLHMQKTLDLFFTDDGYPRAREVRLPDGRVLDVPLLALTPPANLLLDEMQVELAVRIDSLEAVSDMPVGDKVAGPTPDGQVRSFSEPSVDDKTSSALPLKRLSFQIQAAPRSPDSDARKEANVMDIKMIFRRNESPEGVSRLVSIFTDAMFHVRNKADK